MPNFPETHLSFWTGPICFVWILIKKISPEKSNLNLTKIIRTRSKQFQPVQIVDFFGPREGHGMKVQNQY